MGPGFDYRLVQSFAFRSRCFVFTASKCSHDFQPSAYTRRSHHTKQRSVHPEGCGLLEESIFAVSQASLAKFGFRKSPRHQTKPMDSDSNILSLRYLSSWKKSNAANVANYCLVVTGFLDFCSSMSVRHANPTGSTNHFILDWLQSNSERIGILFSLIWFVDSFVWADHRRLQAMERIDKKSLLSHDTADDVEWRHCQDVYVRTMAFQILMLPVGFVESLLNFVTGILVTAPLPAPPSAQLATTSTVRNPGTSRSTATLGFVVLEYIGDTVAPILGERWESFRHDRVRRIIRLLMIYGIRHPFRFRRRLKRWLRTFRWIKQLAPVVGTLNKLRGNLGALKKRYRQYYRTKRAKNLRVLRRQQMTDAALREYCAILIQKTFRSHNSRRKLRLMNMISAKEDVFAAISLQRQLRKWMRRAKARLRRDWQELKRLHAIPLLEMNPDERRRMYTLRMELQKETDYLLNKKLLLRPNTSFAVFWKLLFVVSAFFEISVLSVRPIAIEAKRSKVEKPVSWETNFIDMYIPKPLVKSPVCRQAPVRKKNIIARLFRRSTTTAKPAILPWYCNKTVSRLQSKLVVAAIWLIHQTVNIFWFISFLDVFVVFFTGSYNSVSGRLEPAPFVVRWIVPGLCFQLLVNDKVEKAYSVVRQMIEGLLHHGPNRVFRWTIVLFFPLGMKLRDMSRQAVYQYIREQNRILANKQLSKNQAKWRDALVVREASTRSSRHSFEIFFRARS